MKLLVVVLLSIFLDGVQDLAMIGKINAYKKNAGTAYQEKRFKEAEQYYTYLRDTLKIQEDEVLINLGHTYLQLNQPEYAAQCYENVLKSKNKINASIAANHLGVLAYHQNQDKEKAKSLFKEALRQNPENTDARHNLEWISKLREQDKKENKDKKDNQENKDKKEEQNNGSQNSKDNTQNDKDPKSKEGQDKNNNKGSKDLDKDSEKGDKNDKNKDDKNTKNKQDSKETNDQNKGKDGKSDNKKNQDVKDKKSESTDVNKKGDKDKKPNTNDPPTQLSKEGKNKKDQLVGNQQVLTKMGMTDQRAKALLDAMKASEVQYIQQMKKETDKPKKSKNRPDW